MATIPTTPCTAGRVREPGQEILANVTSILCTWVDLIDEQGAGEQPDIGAGGEEQLQTEQKTGDIVDNWEKPR